MQTPDACAERQPIGLFDTWQATRHHEQPSLPLKLIVERRRAAPGRPWASHAGLAAAAARCGGRGGDSNQQGLGAAGAGERGMSRARGGAQRAPEADRDAARQRVLPQVEVAQCVEPGCVRGRPRGRDAARQLVEAQLPAPRAPRSVLFFTATYMWWAQARKPTLRRAQHAAGQRREQGARWRGKLSRTGCDTGSPDCTPGAAACPPQRPQLALRGGGRGLGGAPGAHMDCSTSTEALGRRPHTDGSDPVSAFWRSTSRNRPAPSGSRRSSQAPGSVPERLQRSRRSVCSAPSAGAAAQPGGSVPARARARRPR